MLIQKMQVGEAGPIRAPLHFDFDPDVNVLIGPNGCGKSSVLRLLRWILEYEGAYDVLIARKTGDEGATSHDWWLTDKAEAILSGGLSTSRDQGIHCYDLPFVFIPAIRLPFPAIDRIIPDYVFAESPDPDQNVLDGKAIFKGFQEYENRISVQINRHGKIDDRYDQSLDIHLQWGVIAPGRSASEREKLLEEREHRLRRTWTQSDVADRKQAVLTAAAECAFEICSDVMADSILGSHSVRLDADPLGRGITQVSFDHRQVNTVDDSVDTLTIGDLSSGTQGVLMWLLHLAMEVNLQFLEWTQSYRTARYQERPLAEWEHIVAMYKESYQRHGALPRLWKLDLNDSEDLFEEVPHDAWRGLPFVLLIDEIENQLHPTWQRRVIPAIKRYFPHAQIFAATHSPFVVAGLKAGQVHILNRDADGVVQNSTNERDIIGWTTDEILRTFMGVDEPTDQLTVDRARRLRELRGQETLSDAEKDEMENLRRQINADFISSSTPLEAQRERYGDMMLDFLRSRQSELSQDSS